jgi:hypothetical protein
MTQQKWIFKANEMTAEWVPDGKGNGMFRAWFDGELDTDRKCKTLEDAENVLSAWGETDISWEVVNE